MRLNIDGHEQDFIDLQSFQTQHGLDADFGVSIFEPKDLTGLGHIDGAGAEMIALYNNTLHHLPDGLPLMAWLDYIPTLQAHFCDELEAVNASIGLRQPEIEFAVSGLGDVCRALVYGVIYAHAQKHPLPKFDDLYRDWLYSTVRVAGMTHRYQHHDQVWKVYVISHAYGRVGLRIEINDQPHYVIDNRLACPAERFMERLLGKIADHIMAHII
jgi:hypothetical protein